MPPKNASKGGNKESKKTELKKKEKIVEDKTFGLKNKKGSKQQKFIQQVQHQVKNSGLNKTQKQLEKEKEDAKKEKEKKKNEIDLLNAILKPVQQQAGKGVDPKSVVCAFYKQGTCSKGAKCKFSHDLAVEKKVEKRSAYIDMREDKETNEDWDEEKLKDVVSQKHGRETTNQTEIICKFFIEAVENSKYGWFWQCKNGDDCKYRHALPPDYVLKKDRKKADKADKVSIEELVERERAALGHNTTKVTEETFKAWYKKKAKEKALAEKKKVDKKKSDYKSGRDVRLSGRERFLFDPSLATAGDDNEDDDEGATVDLAVLRAEDEDDEVQYREINFTSGYREAEDTQATGGVSIDEDLFAEEDLEEMEEELDGLSLS